MKALPHVGDKRVIDMHVHIGPEFLRRKYSAETLAAEARKEGFGVVMKNHFQPTTGQVSQLRRPDDKVALVGSVALNFGCGGVDDHGVRSALSGWKRDVTAADPDSDRFVVWMPTMCCEAHLRKYNRRDLSEAWGIKGQYTRYYAEGTGYTLDEGNDDKMAALRRALQVIADNDLILATGHFDRNETLTVVRIAHEMGIRRIIMTHPLFQTTELDPETMRRMWEEYGAYSELAFVNLAMDDLSYEQYIEVIEGVGSQGVILSSDVGQVFSAGVGDALREFFSELQARGVKEDDIVQMSVMNTNKLLFEDMK
ncbi:DUF6282 family protein [Aminobacter aganoensis]|uniref:Cytosolic protein n=1 Tax=Aminobacter aganoensis TaxID=83264 RepID=A0A7X0F544_9HYPH|nr:MULTISPECIES: DUF6282 family protein [Aminobacter]KQU65694.1 hypothetical protein ASC75_10780 [Aminobacter sp. DSM 101952]MBB6353261.1 hypothetical protein [Aminobacter aganoensis]